MGGPGSGRRSGVRQPRCEDYPKIDLGRLRRRGLLTVGRISTFSWSGQPIASLKLTGRRDGVQLEYHIGGDHGESESVSELVAFVKRAAAFGGRRKWFRCNGCGKGCRILYGNRYFRCRSCHRLHYASQYVPAHQRAVDRADQARERLGDHAGNVFNADAFPGKPPRTR